MNKDKDPDGLSRLFNSGAKIPWEKSKEEVWSALEDSIRREDLTRVRVRHLHPNRQWLALAASLVLLLSVFSFMRFYTVNSHCPEGVRTSG